MPFEKRWVKITKKDIENVALAVIKEVIKDKKCENLTKGVIENTDESYTTEQVKRIVEEVNKKVFTMAFENLEDKNFSFEVANIDEVLKAKKYKPTIPTYVRKKTTHEKVAEKIKNMNGDVDENFKKIAYAISEFMDVGKFENSDIESSRIASEIIEESFGNITEKCGEKTASKILDNMRRMSSILKAQDKNLKKIVKESSVLAEETLENLNKIANAFEVAYSIGPRAMTYIPLWKNQFKETVNEAANWKEPLKNSFNKITGEILGRKI